MDALTAADVSMVGVYGAGGVGKTTLLKEVARKAREEKLFHVVAMVNVSQEVNDRSIQGEIADMLGLEIKEESVAGRAGRLFERLKKKAAKEDNAKNEEKILIILDDLWKELDLEKIGIPSEKQRSRGCKILLTSRNYDVLRNRMNCQKNLQVGTLDEDEAWGLFQMMAESSFENNDRQSTAKEVAKMCKGLPVAIVTVARTLRKKRLNDWEDVLRQLQQPSLINPTEMLNGIYSPIEFSYKNLENLEQSTFLLCSQMGFNATTKDLLKYGIGLILFRKGFTLEATRGRVSSLVENLKAVCLLQNGKTDEELVMHDLVRDASRLIAAREGGVLIVNDEKEMKELVDHKYQVSTDHIWLNCNIEKLPEEMQCPKLVLFHVDNKNPTLKIPDKLFIGMHLTTLSFTGVSFPYLPSSLDSLRNLKTLCIHESPELGDVSVVGKLRKLEVLSFVKSIIRHLPIEIGQLTKLKLLDLSRCSELVAIPPNVLSKLSQLEGLLMGKSFANWGGTGSEGGDTSIATVSELQKLTSLTSLDIQIHSISSCRGIFSNRKLGTYRIFIGEVWKWGDENNECSRTLKLQFMGNSNGVDMQELGVMELLKESEEVCFHGLEGVKDFIGELDKDRSGFPKLKHLLLQDSPEIQFIHGAVYHSTSEVDVDPFPMLESLKLHDLNSIISNICVCYIYVHI